MNKVKNDLIIEPTSEEIELLSEIVISCKNQGCDKIFKISELKELKSHEEICESKKSKSCQNCSNLEFLTKNLKIKIDDIQKKIMI